MTDVFVAERGQLTPQSKRDLRAAGVVVVEVRDRDRCAFVRPGEVMGANDLTWAALHALTVDDGYGSHGTAQREQLARNLLTVVEVITGRTQ